MSKNYLFDTETIVNQEGYLIVGSFTKTPDGIRKNNFWSNVIDKRIPILSFLFDEMRHTLMTQFFKSETEAIIDFVAFNGYYKKPFEINDDCYSLDEKFIKEQILPNLNKSKFGLFKVGSCREDKKIIVQNLMGVEEQISELAASIYISIMTCEYAYNFFIEKNVQLPLANILQNRNFLFDLVLGLEKDEIRSVYNLLD